MEARTTTDLGDETMPVLSTTDRGTRMTQLPAGQPVGEVTAVLVLRVLAGIAAWAAVSSVPYAAVLDLAPTHASNLALGSPWSAASAILLAFVAIFLTVRVYRGASETFGQSRVAGLLASLMVTGGGSVGAIGWTIASYAGQPTPPFALDHIATSSEIPRELGVVLGGLVTAWAVFTGCRLVLAVRHAQSRQRTIESLRRSGDRHQGVVTSVDFRNTWLWDQPVFRIQVSYADQGAQKTVLVHMRTHPSRVLVVGSPLAVLTNPAGSVQVELDREAGAMFEEDHTKFAAPEG